MKWKLFYHDGSTFSDEDGSPQESPKEGVLFIVQPGQNPDIMVNADWFMWREDLDEWTECGSDGFADQAVLFGHLISCWRKTLWVRTPDFMRIWDTARKELGR